MNERTDLLDVERKLHLVRNTGNGASSDLNKFVSLSCSAAHA